MECMLQHIVATHLNNILYPIVPVFVHFADGHVEQFCNTFLY